MVFFSFAVIGTLWIKIVTIRDNRSEASVNGANSHNSMNISSYNKDLESLAVKVLVTAIIMVFAIVAVVHMKTNTCHDDNPVISFILEDLVNPIIGMVVAPIIVIASNREIYEHTLEFYGRR